MSSTYRLPPVSSGLAGFDWSPATLARRSDDDAVGRYRRHASWAATVSAYGMVRGRHRRLRHQLLSRRQYFHARGVPLQIRRTGR